MVREAVARGCNLIVAHHPVLFRPVNNLRPENYVRRTLGAAIKADMAIYAAHTNLDNVLEGVNARIADKLQLTERSILLPTAPGAGSGLVGSIREPMPSGAFLQLLWRAFSPGVIRYNGLVRQQIGRVAICGGAGSFLIDKALAAKADAFVTADIKYHEFFDAEDRLLLCDIGHFESEQFTIDLLAELLLRKFPNFAVLKSEIVTNPVHYFSGK